MLICFLCLNNGQMVLVDMVIPLSTSTIKKLMFKPLGRTNHGDCLLHGAHSHRNH
jgi:hypothetical protein